MKEQLKIVVCDEKKSDRKYIEEVIRDYLVRRRVRFALQIFESGEHLCQEENDLSQYDVLFLDANMQKMNGIETAYQIRKKGWDIKIVLLSEMIDYAVDGYHVGAIRYVMKENMKKELPECLEFVLRDRRSDEKEIAFPMKGGERTISLGEILYVESEKHKLCFKFVEGNSHMYGKMDELDEQLAESGFVRVHQSFLANMKYVEKISNYRLYMTDGSVLPITRSRYSSVKKHFANYQNCEV